MSIESERIEAMEEILNNLGLSLTDEQVKAITKDLSFHIEMEREIGSYQFSGYKEECSKCKKLESELKDAKSDIEVYRKSVEQRRKTREVWIEDGSVMYKPN